jgi:hypothetical protein
VDWKLLAHKHNIENNKMYSASIWDALDLTKFMDTKHDFCLPVLSWS